MAETPSGHLQDGSIIEFVASLMRTHLTLAMDNYLACRGPKDAPWSWIQQSHAVVSSILHAYCSFETAINEVGHSLFFNKESFLYIPVPTRSYPVRRLISSWQTIPCLEKYSILLDILSQQVDSNHAAKLREVNTLRNKIAHGFLYQTTIMVADEGGHFVDAIREDSVNWAAKFPNCRFSPLDQLDHEDAAKVLSAVLEGLLVAHGMLGIPMVVTSYYHGPNNTVVSEPEAGSSILARHVESAIRRARERSADPDATAQRAES